MVSKGFLEELYAEYNRRECALCDPVKFLYLYEDAREREVAGLIAALLAYGRLEQILRSVAGVLDRLEGSPRKFLLCQTPQELLSACRGFKHRVTSAKQLAGLLCAVKGVLEAHGSLQACFCGHDDPSAQTILPGLSGLAGELERRGGELDHLVAHPARGSACKRWNLYLRWMVRCDAVDPGGWREVSPARLIVPLDAHMWRVCRQLGLTRRKTCNLRAALEITDAFRRISPGDPVRYDFALMHASRDGRLDEMV